MSLKVWAHMSIAWWIYNAFERSYKIGWNALQIFAKSPRGWHFAYDNIQQQDYIKAVENFAEYNQKWWVIHSVYLINLAKNYNEAKQAINSVIDDFKIAEKIGFEAVNIHLGKYQDLSKQEAIKNMIDNVKIILEQTADSEVFFVFENTAGQWTEIWWNFEELADVYKALLDKLQDIAYKRIKFCIDTAHAWWAGYNINDFEAVLEEFNRYIWVDNILFFHINDAKVPMWSKLDRHASLGRWFIGLSWLSQVIKWAVKNNKPLILETPQPDLWPEEINIIKSIANWKYWNEQIKQFDQKYKYTQTLKKFENYKNSLF